MITTNKLNIKKNNLLEVVKKIGTPAYVYDASVIQEQVYKLLNLHKAIQLFYSLKANPNPSIVKLIYDLGANLEICSLKELEIIKKIGVSPERVLYLGPGKTEEEIRKVFEYGVKYFIVESLQEMQKVNNIAQEKEVTVRVGIRINPSVSAKGSKLTMGGKPRQFGMDEEQLENIFELEERLSNLKIVGIHVYNGTRILSSDVFIENTAYILNLAKKVQEQFHVKLDYIDIGGGMGIPYFSNESTLDLDDISDRLNAMIQEFYSSFGEEIPIFLESGRYVVGESGIYVTKVLYEKKSKNCDFLTVDGGTHHHMAAGGMGNALKKNFPIKVLNKWSDEPNTEYYISGPLCTPNDLIAKKISLPKSQPGDYIGILNAGAYGLTASPVLFLSHHLPTEVLVKDDKYIVIRKKTEYDLPVVQTFES
ncbi:diaminopimelate decarboxylase [Bacillus mycoides]|uniref:diaminopimelate decarboxylase n=1 Tax=Bacillus mycoides TaxID=1405 RepID=UPI003D03DA1D